MGEGSSPMEVRRFLCYVMVGILHNFIMVLLCNSFVPCGMLAVSV